MPWHTSLDDEEAYGPSVKVQFGERMSDSRAEVEMQAGKGSVPRRVNITNVELEDSRGTVSSRGASGAARGSPADRARDTQWNAAAAWRAR